MESAGSFRSPTVRFEERDVDAVFAPLDQTRLPGAVVGIAVGGRVVYRKGFGLANIELPVVLSPTTRLRIGSTSKQFTCLAFLLLCEEGRASIDDPVGKYLPELPPVTGRVSMAQLMANTSGIRDAYHLFDSFNDLYTAEGGASQRTKTSDLLELYRGIDDTNAVADATWIYNNGGWLLLTVAIERITAAPLERLLWDRVFEPIGMLDSLLLRSDAECIANRGAQHVGSAHLGFRKRYWGVDNYVGAGAIVSTVDDMLRWMAHMDRPWVGSQATWELMRTPRLLAEGTSTGYAFGLSIDSYRGISTLQHAGNALGGNAQMLKVPSASLDVVVISNRQDVSSVALVKQILDSVLPEPKPGPGAGTTGNRLIAGTFWSPVSKRVIQLFGKEGRQFASFGGLDLALEAGADQTLWFTEFRSDPKTGLTIVGDPDQPSAIRLHEFGAVEELVPVPSYGTNSVGASGRFVSATASAEVVISGTAVSARGPFGQVEYVLEPLGHNVWRARPAHPSAVGFFGAMLVFDEDGSRFHFSNFQIRPLPFTRAA